MNQRKRQGKVFGRQVGYRKSDAKLLKEFPGVSWDLEPGISICKIAAIYSISVNTVQKIKQAAINQGLLENRVKQKEASIN